MTCWSRAALLFCAAAAGCAAPRATSPPAAPASAAADGVALDDARVSLDDWLRVRCALDGSEVWFAWRGHLLAALPDGRAQKLFDLVGANVARCGRDADGWYQTSRELMLYLDPDTGRPLDRWTNPFTGRSVPVVHVANSPVQARLSAPPRARAGDGVTSFQVDVPLSYPNPLAREPTLARYSPQPRYEATELFVLSASTAALRRATTAVPSVQLVWHRLGPFLPWMDLGDTPGRLVYSAVGARLARYEELPAPLRALIDDRMPLFRHPPRCRLAGRDETSWSYFAAHVDAYERGERFPLARPVVDEACR